jgi:Holliday junction resolvase RusA-like endonuclease
VTPLHLTVPGPPRTKKNSGRIIPRGQHHIILPSEAWETWRDMALPWLRREMARLRLAPMAHPVNCLALFYRDANRGDAVGYYQGLADVLEKAGVVVNDKWIVSWDGSRLMKDASRPRVELELTSAED